MNILNENPKRLLEHPVLCGLIYGIIEEAIKFVRNSQ